MSRTKVSDRTGRMLFEMAREAGSLDKTAQQLSRIAELLAQSPEAAKPVLGEGAKKEDLRNLVEVLGSTAGVFQELYNQYQGIQEARVESASPLDDQTKKAFEEKIKKQVTGKVRVKFSVNKNLLAGFKLLVGEKIIDCSAASQLRRMRQAMLQGK